MLGIPAVILAATRSAGGYRAPMRVSAGLLLYREKRETIEVLLVHPGGPFWAKKDEGAWSIPKGEIESGEDPYQVARREFEEELGSPPPTTEPIPLGSVIQRSGKVVHGWACEGDFDPDRLVSNTFSTEWPPRSGRISEFPEVDRAAWFDPTAARRKLNRAQGEFIDRLLARLGIG